MEDAFCSLPPFIQQKAPGRTAILKETIFQRHQLIDSCREKNRTGEQGAFRIHHWSHHMQPMELPLQQCHPDAEQEPCQQVAIDKKKTEFLRGSITSFGDPGKSENHGYRRWQHHGGHHRCPHRYTREKSMGFHSDISDGGIHISDIGNEVICQCW